MNPGDFILRNTTIRSGESKTVLLRFARLYDNTKLAIPVKVVNGRKPGPVLFVSAAVHGDELNGVEIISRLLKMKILAQLRGTLLAIPVVNVMGFNERSRYLPDRRDLNRCFPGTRKGSLASRIAYIFMDEIVKRSTHGIDLHTGAIHRTNLPQIRAAFKDKRTETIARAFGAPVILNSELRDGSLRAAALEKGVPVLVYEAGEALRFDELAIQAGVRGIIRVMREIGMLPPRKRKTEGKQAFVALSSSWLRASRSGIMRTSARLGQTVVPGDVLGVIAGPLGEQSIEVRADREGIIIGLLNLPLVSRGDAIFHIAYFRELEPVGQRLDDFYGDQGFST